MLYPKFLRIFQVIPSLLGRGPGEEKSAPIASSTFSKRGPWGEGREREGEREEEMERASEGERGRERERFLERAILLARVSLSAPTFL